MIGDIIVVDGVEWEVTWSGGEGLIADRETKSVDTYSTTKRAYHKRAAFWDKYQTDPRKLDKPEKPLNNGILEAEMINPTAEETLGSGSNGKVEIDQDNLSTGDKIDILFEAITQLGEQLREQHEEILEKFANLNLPGVDYEVLQEES